MERRGALPVILGGTTLPPPIVVILSVGEGCWRFTAFVLVREHEASRSKNEHEGHAMAKILH